jgi:hypothetical protein
MTKSMDAICKSRRKPPYRETTEPIDYEHEHRCTEHEHDGDPTASEPERTIRKTRSEVDVTKRSEPALPNPTRGQPLARCGVVPSSHAIFSWVAGVSQGAVQDIGAVSDYHEKSLVRIEAIVDWPPCRRRPRFRMRMLRNPSVCNANHSAIPGFSRSIRAILH